MFAPADDVCDLPQKWHNYYTQQTHQHTQTQREIRRQYETLHAIRGNLKRASELPSSACWTCARPSPSWGSSSVPHPPLPMVYGRRVALAVGRPSVDLWWPLYTRKKCISMPTALADPPGSPCLIFNLIKRTRKRKNFKLSLSGLSRNLCELS